MDFEVCLKGLHVLLLISTIFFSQFITYVINWLVEPRYSIAILLEFIIIAISTILSVTLLNQWMTEIIVVTAIFTLSFAITLKLWKSWAHLEFSNSRPVCVTLCRSSVFLITSVCISAVDFNMFAPDLMKTEEYGSRLMDTGIGLFIFSIAIVPRKVSNRRPFLKEVSSLVRSVLPLIVLGVGRTVILKQINYNQDVTEYGLHWNAFLTIGFTKLLADLICRIAPQKEYILSAILLILHELTLQLGFANWVMDDDVERNTLLTANREGIVSIPGFVALYLASRHISRVISYDCTTMNYSTYSARRKQLLKLTFCIYLAFFALAPFTHISRRVANSGYVLWVLVIATSMLCLFMYFEELATALIQNEEKQKHFVKLPFITEAVNFNSLFFFLISNVFTGMINIFLNTTERTDCEALAILILYMATVCGLVVYFYRKKLKII